MKLIEFKSPVRIYVENEDTGDLVKLPCPTQKVCDAINLSIYQERCDTKIGVDFGVRGIACYSDIKGVICVNNSVYLENGKMFCKTLVYIDDEFDITNESLINELAEEISGQYSDGWGEGFEQNPITVDEVTLYVSFWQFNGFRMEVVPRPDFNEVLGGLKHLCDLLEEINDKE